MAMMIFEPLSDAMPVQLDLDFDLEDLGFRTLSSEAPPAEALEPSLSVTDEELSPPLSMAGCDIWKNDLLSDRCNSPVPRSVIEYLQEVEQASGVKTEFDEDFMEGWSPLIDTKPLRNDCMWAGEIVSESTDLSVRSAGKSAPAAAAAAAPSPLPAVKDALAGGAAVKCEPAVIVKREPCEDTIVALSCGPVLTTVAPTGGLATGASIRTGARTQTSLLNKSEVSLLKSNNRSLLISSRTASASASNTVPTSPVKNNTSERVKVQSAVMWGPWLGAGSASCYQRSALESDGDSPRPYTPPSQSESDGDEDDEHPRFKHSLDMVFGLGASWFDDVDSASTAASTSSLDAVSVLNCELDLDDEYAVAEAAEQMCRSVANSSTESGRAKSNSRKPEKKNSAQDELLETSRLAFMSDHSYHLSKGSVKTEHLGVQTPSDSEEEIDVVSVGDKQSSRASPASAAALPTNPSARDRQQLQRTMASAIKHGSSGARVGAGTATAATPVTGEAPERGRIPVRFTLGERTVSVRTVPLTEPYDAGASASSDEHTSPTRVGRKRGSVNGGGGGGSGGATPGAAAGGRGASATKRPRVQYQHRLQHHAPRGRGRRPRGDDNEPDPTEKRSLHNDMERQRRIDLRNLVDDLRRLVPDLKDNKRAAKVMILREAAKYCRTLREDGRALVAESAMLRRAQDRMMTRLSSLRRDLAAQRL